MDVLGGATLRTPKGLAGHPLVSALRRGLRPVEAFFLLMPVANAQDWISSLT